MTTQPPLSETQLTELFARQMKNITLLEKNLVDQFTAAYPSGLGPISLPGNSL